MKSALKKGTEWVQNRHLWKNKKGIAIDTAALYGLSWAEILGLAKLAGKDHGLSALSRQVMEGDWDTASRVLAKIMNADAFGDVSINSVFAYLVLANFLGLGVHRIWAKKKAEQAKSAGAH